MKVITRYQLSVKQDGSNSIFAFIPFWCSPFVALVTESSLQNGTLENDRCNSSDTEGGVLTAITRSVPAPPERGTHRHRWMVTRLPLLLYPWRSENLLTYPAGSHPHTLSTPWEDNCYGYSIENTPPTRLDPWGALGAQASPSVLKS
ncbi:hypothetical protein AVEN_83197-1 [Araneus ventricosus]|uniref:Uncharacterized protein n=1 Tax=Araneus ventricosus TaxID=182803 RepID=A0A4Y2ANR8_ARAVE|nr:hypothetical protein AVEN_83197-1 [Araneus ventricosus]